MEHYYYELKGGRIWSTELARWVGEQEIPAGTILNRLFRNGQPAGIDYLISVLNQYGYELGELAGEEKDGQ